MGAGLSAEMLTSGLRLSGVSLCANLLESDVLLFARERIVFGEK